MHAHDNPKRRTRSPVLGLEMPQFRPTCTYCLTSCTSCQRTIRAGPRSASRPGPAQPSLNVIELEVVWGRACGYETLAGWSGSSAVPTVSAENEGTLNPGATPVPRFPCVGWWSTGNCWTRRRYRGSRRVGTGNTTPRAESPPCRPGSSSAEDLIPGSVFTQLLPRFESVEVLMPKSTAWNERSHGKSQRSGI